MVTINETKQAIKPYINVFKNALELNHLHINITIVGSKTTKIYSEIHAGSINVETWSGRTCISDDKAEVFLICKGIRDRKDAISTLAHELLHVKFFHSSKKAFKSHKGEESVIILFEKLLRTLIH